MEMIYGQEEQTGDSGQIDNHGNLTYRIQLYIRGQIPPGQSSEGDQVAVYGQAGPGRDTGIHRARRILSCRFSAGQCWTGDRIIPENYGFFLPDFSGLHDGSRK